MSRYTIGLADLGGRHHPTRVGAEAHGAPQVGDSALIGQQIDDRVRRVGIELSTVGTGESAEIPRELDHRALHPEANPEEGNQLLPRVRDRGNLPLDPAASESAGNQHARDVGEMLLGAVPLDFLRIHGLDRHLAVVGDSAVRDGLEQTLVRVAQIEVLPDDSDGHLLRDGCRTV